MCNAKQVRRTRQLAPGSLPGSPDQLTLVAIQLIVERAVQLKLFGRGLRPGLFQQLLDNRPRTGSKACESLIVLRILKQTVGGLIQVN